MDLATSFRLVVYPPPTHPDDNDKDVQKGGIVAA